MKTDLLTVWPKSVDYPYFRYFLGKYRHYFDGVYIGLVVGSPERDLSQFLQTNVKATKFLHVSPHQGHQDWRDHAVNELLLCSTADKVLFMEQDFLIHNEQMVRFISETDKDFVGYMEGNRVHPSFACVKRHLIEKTSKNFAADPPLYDHFGKFFREVLELTEPRYIEYCGFERQKDFFHLNGLTQNYSCYRENQPFYQTEEFLTYNHMIQKLPIIQSDEFIKLSKEIETKYGTGDRKYIKRLFPFNDEDDEAIKSSQK